MSTTEDTTTTESTSANETTTTTTTTNTTESSETTSTTSTTPITYAAVANTGVEAKPNKEKKQQIGKFFPTLCVYHMRGYCRDGDNCQFLHLQTGGAPVFFSAHMSFQSSSVIPCRYYFNGSCTKGDDCRYSHSITPEMASKANIHANYSPQVYTESMPVKASGKPNGNQGGGKKKKKRKKNSHKNNNNGNAGNNANGNSSNNQSNNGKKGQSNQINRKGMLKMTYLAQGLAETEAQGYKAAGFLLMGLDPNTNKPVMLLSSEKRQQDMPAVINFLGGKRIEAEESDAVDTAIRELDERTGKQVSSELLQFFSEQVRGAVDSSVLWYRPGKYALFIHSVLQKHMSEVFQAVDTFNKNTAETFANKKDEDESPPFLTQLVWVPVENLTSFLGFEDKWSSIFSCRNCNSEMRRNTMKDHRYSFFCSESCAQEFGDDRFFLKLEDKEFTILPFAGEVFCNPDLCLKIIEYQLAQGSASEGLTKFYEISKEQNSTNNDSSSSSSSSSSNDEEQK